MKQEIKEEINELYSLFTTRPKLNVKTTKQHIETFTNKYRINPLRREVNKVISSCRCAWCGASSKKVREGFRDELSKKEYQISALCQKCQDEVFTAPKETSRQRKFNFYD